MEAALYTRLCYSARVVHCVTSVCRVHCHITGFLSGPKFSCSKHLTDFSFFLASNYEFHVTSSTSPSGKLSQRSLRILAETILHAYLSQCEAVLSCTWCKTQTNSRPPGEMLTQGPHARATTPWRHTIRTKGSCRHYLLHQIHLQQSAFESMCLRPRSGSLPINATWSR